MVVPTDNNLVNLLFWWLPDGRPMVAPTDNNLDNCRSGGYPADNNLIRSRQKPPFSHFICCTTREFVGATIGRPPCYYTDTCNSP